MDNIWELIEGSKRYIWRQLHSLDGEVFNLLYPGYSYKFLGSGAFTKIHLKLHIKLKEKNDTRIVLKHIHSVKYKFYTNLFFLILGPMTPANP